MGETNEFYTDWTESYDSFDQMNLHENLLRGIYAYGARPGGAAAWERGWQAAAGALQGPDPAGGGGQGAVAAAWAGRAAGGALCSPLPAPRPLHTPSSTPPSPPQQVSRSRLRSSRRGLGRLARGWT